MNTLAKIKPNQLAKATKALEKFNYDVPTEIREDEAHLNHIIVAQATPNVKTMEFDTVAKVVKLNDESLEVVKSQLPKHGIVVMLHDGKQFKVQKAQEENEAKEQAKEKAKEKAEGEQFKDKELKKQAEKIAELEKQLASKQKVEPTKAVKLEKAEGEVEGTIEEVTKKTNGKG